jgi:hypothetical protein
MHHGHSKCASSQIFTEVNIQVVFWSVTPYSPVGGYQHVRKGESIYGEDLARLYWLGDMESGYSEM